MSGRSTFYSFVAALAAMAGSGLLYMISASHLAAFGEMGEGTAEEIRHAVNARNFSLVLLGVTSVLAVILFLRFVKQRGSDD